MLIPLQNQKTESIIDKQDLYLLLAQTYLCKQTYGTIQENLQNSTQSFKIKTTSFHPQSNGALERTHGTVKDLLRTSIDETRTD